METSWTGWRGDHRLHASRGRYANGIVAELPADFVDVSIFYIAVYQARKPRDPN